MAKEDRGFASMDRSRQREIASRGGKAAHERGTAHEWTAEEARAAGRKGGISSHRRRLQLLGGDTPVIDTAVRADSARPAGDSVHPGAKGDDEVR